MTSEHPYADVFDIQAARGVNHTTITVFPRVHLLHCLAEAVTKLWNDCNTQGRHRAPCCLSSYTEAAQNFHNDSFAAKHKLATSGLKLVVKYKPDYQQDIA